MKRGPGERRGVSPPVKQPTGERRGVSPPVVASLHRRADAAPLAREDSCPMNPIIRRELLEVLRTRKALAAQLVLALGCALLVLVHWPTGDVTDLTGARSLGVLRVFGYGLLAGALLIVPAFPAT